MYGNCITKTVEVTITLSEHGDVRFDYYEPESGDMFRVSTSLERMAEDETGRVGTEIMSWASLMADEMSEEKKQQGAE